MPEQQYTFLVADSDPEGLNQAGLLLQESGHFNYLQAEDGAEAWALVKSFNIDCFICAEQLEEIKPLSLLKLLRSNEDYNAMPFILTTTAITAQTVTRYGRAGVSEILVRPITFAVFQVKLNDVLSEAGETDNIEFEKAYKTGLDLMKGGKADEALKTFEEALDIHENAEIYFNMGYLKTAKGEYEEALKCFRKATRIQGDNARAFKMMGDIYLKLNQPDQAAECLDHAAEIFMDGKNDTEAEEVYQTVVRLRPDSINVYNSLGIIYRRRKKFGEAVLQYEKALKVHPDDSNIFYNLARVYVEMNDFGKAGQVLDQALILEPGFTAARELKRALDMGMTFRA